MCRELTRLITLAWIYACSSFLSSMYCRELSPGIDFIWTHLSTNKYHCKCNEQVTYLRPNYVIEIAHRNKRYCAAYYKLARINQLRLCSWSICMYTPFRQLTNQQKDLITLQRLSALAADIQQRCFSVSPLSFAAAKVAMSKFDSDSYLPYDKLQANLKVIKKR